MNTDKINIFKKIKDVLDDFEDTLLFSGNLEMWYEKHNKKKEVNKK